MTYQELYDKIVAVKDKYSAQILAIEGVHGVGVNVTEQKIIVSVHDMTTESMLQIPTELEGYTVECRGSFQPKQNVISELLPSQYRRPIVPGRSVGRTYWAGAGTITGIFWSEALQTHVGHTNHHVLAAYNQAFKRQDTNNSVSFTVLAGGTPDTVNPDFHDDGTINPGGISWKRWDYAYWQTGLYGNPNGKAHINSIEPTSARVGEVVTINAQVVGPRRGNSTVYFNGVPAKVKSWVSTYDHEGIVDFFSTIEVYVPELTPSDVQVKINVEGETVYAPANMDAEYTLAYEVGNVEDWIPMAGVVGQIAEGYSDSAMFTFHPSMPIKAEYTMEPSVDATHINYPTHLGVAFPNRRYRMQGIYHGPFYEGMCIMKTGRTSGTTFAIVQDPSWDWLREDTDADWYNAPTTVMKDTILTYGQEFINAMPVNEDEQQFNTNLNLEGYGAYFSAPGDSGSGVFTASYADYVAWCNHYGLVPRMRRPDLPPDPPPGLLIGTDSFGNPYDGSGGGDKAYRYVDYYGLSLNKLPMEIEGETAKTSGTQLVVTLYTEWSVSPSIRTTTSVGLIIQQGVIWSAYPSIQSASRVDLTMQRGVVTSIGPTNLVFKPAPSNNTSIDCTLMVYLREISLNAITGLRYSTKMSVALVPPVPVDLRAYGPSQATPVLVELELLPVATLDLGVEAPVYTVPVEAGLSVKAYMDLNAVIGSTSSVIAGPQRGTVIPMIPTELVSYVAPPDIKNIDFSLEGYSRAINAEVPLFVLPVSAGVLIDQVFTIELMAASPMTVLPSSVGLQINPAIVTPVGLSVNTPVGPTVKANVELVVKLLPFFLARPDREMEVQAIINNTTYDKTEVVSFDVEDSLIPSEEFVLGSVISSRLTFTIRTSDAIPSNADISPYVRLKGPEGVTDWVPLGKYYVDTRGYQNNVWTFTCFDKLILSQQTFVSALTYPASMAAVFTELRGQLGLTADASVVIDPSYTIPYKDTEITMREMLGYIASAHGASVRLTKDTEQISFVKFKPNATRTNILASEYFHEQQTNPLKTFTAIRLTYNTDGEFLTAGSGDEDHTLNIYNPFMTQVMLNTVFTAFNGFSYMPFTMDWKGNPTINVGASVTVTERSGSTFPSVILTDKSSYKGGLKSTITAPSYSTQRSETDYKGGLKQFVNSQLAKGVQLEEPYYGVTIGRANGIKIEKSDGVSKAYFNSDKIEIARNGSSVFKVNSDGYVELTGVKINGGTITWGTGGANVPTAAQVGARSDTWMPTPVQVGARPDTWTPTPAQVGALATTWVGTTYIDAYGLYTGTISANKINVGTLTGFTIQTATSGARLVLNSSDLTGYNSSGYTSVRLASSSIDFWGSGAYAGYYAGKVYGVGYAMQYDATNGHIFYVSSDQVFNVGSWGSTSFLFTDLSLMGDVTANKFHGSADNLGAPTNSSGYISIGPSSQHTFYHSLGRIPVVVLSGTLGNVMLTQSVTTSSVTVYNYSTGGNTWSGTIYVW